ncbi:MAG TPA: hypothetical protein VIJ25_16135, partial [Methylococcales bacterium]
MSEPQLYKKFDDGAGHIDYYPASLDDIFPTPVEPIILTKQEKAWAGFIIGLVGTAILVTAGFVTGPIQAILF